MGSAATRRTGLAGVCAALLVLSGCAHSHSQGQETVRVTERDFHISAPAAVRAGEVALAVAQHAAPTTTSSSSSAQRGAQLPLRGDGLTVDEDALEKRDRRRGRARPRRARTATLRVHLRPGRYELLCNMSGHYLGGMHADLVVR